MDRDSPEVLLKVDEVNSFYGKAQILFDMTLAVKRGEVAVLLGRNGAGKTTTLKSIMGIVLPVSGRVALKGLKFKSCRRIKPVDLDWNMFLRIAVFFPN